MVKSGQLATSDSRQIYWGITLKYFPCDTKVSLLAYTSFPGSPWVNTRRRDTTSREYSILRDTAIFFPMAKYLLSDPVEALIFFRLLPSKCLNWKSYCDDHSSLSSTTAVQYEFHVYFTSIWSVINMNLYMSHKSIFSTFIMLIQTNILFLYLGFGTQWQVDTLRLIKFSFRILHFVNIK